MSVCDFCKQKPPIWKVNDDFGTPHYVCQKCRPSFTVNAILAELETQRKFFQEKLYNYERYRKTHPGDQLVYKESNSFEEAFQTMMDRLSQIILKKQCGREAKIVPPKPTKSKSKKYNIKNSKKTWQHQKTKKKK